MREETKHAWSTRLQLAGLILRAVALVPVGVFGLFVLLGTFGDGDLLVGALVIGAALAGPLVHGWTLHGLRTGQTDALHRLRYGSVALLVIDGTTAGVFALPAIRRGDLGFPLLFILLVGFHALNAWLGFAPANTDRNLDGVRT